MRGSAQTVVLQEPASKGTVLFQSQGEPPVNGREQGQIPSENAKSEKGNERATELTDRERGALRFTSYDLDARVTPASGRLSMRATVTVVNAGAEPLARAAMQVSSTLVWESVSAVGADGDRVRLEMSQHLIDTDADHTGKASEVVVTLPQALRPGESVTLDAFYAGTVAADAGRLERIGAEHGQALAADWDAIGDAGSSSSSSSTVTETAAVTEVALRGFGDVLWYPVAEPQLFLGDGAKLFQAIGTAKLRDERASIRLRLAVEYRGEPPVAAYFCGKRQALKALSDDADAPVAGGSGIATAEFAAGPMGFRLPSLFVLDRAETLPVPTLAVATVDEGALPRLKDSAEGVAPLLEEWFGPRPLTALTVIDHEGQPFEDGPMVVAPLATLAASSSQGALLHSLTHAWVQTGQPWMDEGLAQFMALLLTEQQQGRAAAVAQMQELLQPLVLAEPVVDRAVETVAAESKAGASDSSVGQVLAEASDELYYRRKAAAVWWMLRSVAGEAALRQALGAWRTQPMSEESGSVQAVAFERLLEKTSHKDLGWFFADWVLHDRGLPDLTIVDVTPRLLPAGQGHDSGWLVAVTVRNEGAAAAEVPLVIRAGSFSTTKAVRLAGFATVTERVLVEAPPTQVLVNDGSVPEVRSSTHVRDVVARSE